jgi:5-formyltetrahydrofolate cyclo-ligase
VNKEILRKQFLLKRKNLTYEQCQAKSQAISQQFFQYFDLSHIKKLHLFLPIQKQNELNTWIIIKEIQENYPHISLIVPRSNFKTYKMESYILDRVTQIVENRWGIPEPIQARKCPDDTIDMILIPLLCVDKQGYRVGYGKGFYDRFIQKCRSDIIKVGFSFFEPVDKIDNKNDTDLKLDYSVMINNILITSEN